MKIMVIDDHAVLRNGIELVLGEHLGDVRIEGFATMSDAMAAVRDDSDWDLAFAMIKPGGFAEPVANLREFCARLATVVISTSDTPDQLALAMQMGARGYIHRSTAPHALPHIVQLVLSGELYFPVMASAEAGNAIDNSAIMPPRLALARGPLTERQKQVLLGIAAGKSNKQIGRDLNILEGTVKVHVRAIMEKFAARNRTQLAIMTTKLGMAAEGATPTYAWPSSSRTVRAPVPAPEMASRPSSLGTEAKSRERAISRAQ